MNSSSSKNTKHTGVNKNLDQSHREVSTQTALNLEDLNTLLLAFLSPKQEACTQTDFICNASAMDDSCGRCEGDEPTGNEDNLDSSLSFSDDIAQHQLSIVKQEVTSQDNGEETSCDPLSSSVEEIEPVGTPKRQKMNVKTERCTLVSQFSVPPSDRVTRSASRKKSVEGVGKKSVQGVVNKSVEGVGKKSFEGVGKRSFERVGKRSVEGMGKKSIEGVGKKSIEGVGKKSIEGVGKKSVNSVKQKSVASTGNRSVENVKKKSSESVQNRTDESNKNESSAHRRLSARISKRKLNQSVLDMQNGIVNAVVKVECVSDDSETFVCPDCGKAFSQASQLKRHAIEHADDSDIFPCDVCSDAFDTKNELSKHKSAKHRSSFYCDICSRHFISSRTLSRHIRSHVTEKPHQCDTCDLTFEDEIQLLDHTCLENNESGSKQPLCCVVCNKSFQGAYKLLQHYRSHTGEKQFHCSKCRRVFSSQNDLRQHKNEHKSDSASSSTSPKMPGEHKEVCEMCGKVLRCRAHLIRHKLTHTGERPFPCDQCDKRFTELSGLKSHVARLHMSVEEKQHVCELCGKEFGILSHLNQHLKSHKKVRVKKERPPKPMPTCELCGMTFSQSYRLNIHMHKHKGTKPFQCEICSKGFLHRHDYRRHLQHRHSIGNNETFEKKYPCEKCPKVFNKAFHLKRHFMVKHSGVRNFPCTMCDKRYAMEEDLRQHMKTHTEGPFPCSVCGKLVVTQRNLQRHMLVHENRPNTQVFKCTDCNIGFFSQTDLDSHSQCHVENNTCKCNFCEATFKEAAELKEHRKSVHSKMTFPINCERCDKIFPTKYKIACHMRTHEKPLVCDLCGDRFSNQQVLRKHMVSHTGIKPYVCEVCGKRFASPYHKKIHCRIHFEREFKCKLCNKGFTEKRSLEKHANVHLRPHQCLHCGKRFATIYHLQHHSARHTGNRPCRCLECNKTFIDMSDLNKHIKIHRKARYACNKCKRYFNTDTGLELHVKTHRFDTRFTCSVCSHKFKLQSHLEKHEKKHAVYSNTVLIESKVRSTTATCSLVKCCLCARNYGLREGDEPFVCKACEKQQAEEHSVIILAMDQAIKMEADDEDQFGIPVAGETTVVTGNQVPVSEVYTEQELFKCTICAKTFMLLENFLSHCEEHPEIEVTIETLDTK